MQKEINTDINKAGWQVNIFPPKLRPYAVLARLDRPIGWWLLLLPAWWAIALASVSSGGELGGGSAFGLLENSARGLMLMLLFLIGAIVMRAAGCVINDLWDRDIDRQVARTKIRPLASGELSARQALIFLGGLLLIGAAILFSLNGVSIILGLAALPLIALYPLMKRITYWPQLFLGITFNFGALIGWAAVTGEIGSAAILLYIGGIFWTLGYDTIYAHQDKEDDLLAGVKSTALRFGARSKYWVGTFYGLGFCFFAAAIISAGGASSLSLVLLAFPAAHMVWQLKIWNETEPHSALRVFKSNKIFGFLILIACIFS
ncbi:MAG: 4-hydroxybenzoate octaprenyltransferase [Alphaproteobacteria bacterium]